MRVLASIALLGLLAGCGTRVVVLTHPETRQSVECRTDRLAMDRAGSVEACVTAYRRSGYQVTGDSDR